MPRANFRSLSAGTNSIERMSSSYSNRHAEIGDGRAQCRVADRHADDETQGEDAVDERPAEFGRAREFSVEMQRLRVHRQCREQHIVHLGDSARHRMLEHLPIGELLEIEACHPSPPADYWPPIIGP